MNSERHICPKCERVLRSPKAWHYCKKVSIDDLFLDKSDELVLAFDAILQAVSPWPDVEISATKNCVVFTHKKAFLIIKPMKSCLEIKFNSKSAPEDEDLHKVVEYGRSYYAFYRIQNEFQLTDRMLDNFRSYYEIS